ncbi:methyl-accepting chemotaxis protein [Thiomicrorhabdus xiamenensis]|uniref:PAS domain-containing protein n=1 Tax=Thiomicrorhabdus xiamenensis TaxID=2739063 RepID=A0A7D4SZH7_9GAMM|nr:methyl-accepting chemotaxis protein [Thiomicrorhabdus xiamenensis]QKI89944.1 PAS domain-containing protein [Thiomicrorhabdus xiamenensis]
MRDNGPVTQKEHILPPDTKIVSHTDLQGNIIAANEAFIDASGYNWKELVGQPHNILRHPDVPAEVFKDFWQTIQAGKPWSQVVKNRCKNGDHYWVYANATPTFENGKITGYMSLRVPASDEEKRQATHAYKEIAAGRMQIKNGIILDAEHRLNPLRHINTASQVIFFAVMLLLSASVSSMFPSIHDWLPTWLFEVFDLAMVAAIIFVMFKHNQKLTLIENLLTSISSGKFDNKIDSFGKNHVQHILGRIQSMQVKLGSDLDHARAALLKSTRIEQALKSANTNIMVADRFRNIIFINDSLMEMLKAAEKDLQKTLPNFDTENLMYQSIDIFHVNPQHQQSILDNLSGTHHARFNIGEVVIDLTVDPIYDNDGQRIGTIAEWKNMTDQLEIERGIESLINEAALGELGHRIDVSKLNDFERELSGSVNTLLEKFSGTLNNVTQVLARMSQGDLTDRMDGAFAGQLNSIKLAINNSMNNLELTLGNVKSGAEEIGTMSKEVATASEDLSERTQQQAASLEQTAASMEEITSTTKHTAENMQAANEISHETARNAQEGIAVMKQTIEAMQGISDLSQKIGEITSVIDSIAFQTNLLALNAAVEAARAGEHGRGFAVVAGEVRSLAQKSAEAAKDISNLINSATTQIKVGTEQVENTNNVFADMVEKINNLETLISEASQTSFEQAKGIEQVNQAMAHLDQTTQQNAALVEQLSATANNMSEQAENQATFISRFQLHQQSGIRSALSAKFAEAKMAHNTWIIRIDSYLAGMQSDINKEQARLDNVCALGQWIYSDGQNLLHMQEMQKLQETHREFHAMVGRIMDAKEIGDEATAQQLKEQLMTLSTEITSLLDELDKKIAGSGTIAPVPSQPSTTPKRLASAQPAPEKSDEWSEF